MPQIPEGYQPQLHPSLNSHHGVGTAPRRSLAQKKSRIVCRADRHNPCPVCKETTKGCSITRDGLHFCRGGPLHGGDWKQIGEDYEFGYYRRVGDCRRGEAPSETADTTTTDWEDLARDYASALHSKLKFHLCETLGVPQRVLTSFPLVGYDKTKMRFTFPERDGRENIIGILGRDLRGSKRVIAGTRRGLTIPMNWREGSKLWLPEGVSDTIAMTAAGLCAVGRPSAGAGSEMLVELLRNVPTEVLVVSENDDAGRRGAQKLADTLTKELSKPIAMVRPPDGYKDVREWLTAPERQEMPWEQRGAELRELLLRTRELSEKSPGDGICFEPLANLEVKPVRWLVPGRVPRGKLVLIAGDGGSGKSTFTRHLGAKITTGKPALGVDYTPDAPGDVIFLAAEDGYEDVVVPSLVAEGADLKRVYRVPYVIEPGTKSKVPFGLQHVQLLKDALKKRPGTFIVVIDPIASFVGRAQIDDYRQAELRSVLDPLASLAEETGVTVIIVAHLNKATGQKGMGQKAIHRIAGSTTYTNAVRLAFLLTEDPADEERRLLMPVKHNLPGVDRSAVAFRLERLPDHVMDKQKRRRQFRNLCPDDFALVAEHMARLVFDAPRSVNADAVMGVEGAEKRGVTKVQRCADWLREFHKDYAYPSKEIDAAAKFQGFTSDNLIDARKLIPNLQKSNPGFQGEWWWGMGDPATWVRRPDPSLTTPSLSTHSNLSRVTRDSRE